MTKYSICTLKGDIPNTYNMGWLRFVGSLKLQVSFAKEPYKRDDILQKRHIILKSLLIVATPCLHTTYTVTVIN